MARAPPGPKGGESHHASSQDHSADSPLAGEIRTRCLFLGPAGGQWRGALDGRAQSLGQEKPDGDGSFINGGFFVLSPKVISGIDGDKTTWEQEPLKNLAKSGQLVAYKHQDFWQPMDTLRDKVQLEEMWQAGKAPWKVW